MCISAPFSSLSPDGAMADNSTHPILEILQSFSTSKTLHSLYLSTFLSHLCGTEEVQGSTQASFLVDTENRIAGNFTKANHRSTTELRYFSIHSSQANFLYLVSREKLLLLLVGFPFFK